MLLSRAPQEEQRLANGPTGTWRRSKAESLVRRSGGSADALGHIGAAGGGSKWGPPGAGAAAAAPMVKRPLEELVTALRKARRADATARPCPALPRRVTARTACVSARVLLY